MQRPVGHDQRAYNTVKVKVKVKVTSICIARLRERLYNALRYGSHMLLANNTISAFTCKHSQAAPPCIYAKQTHEFNLLLIYQP